MPALHPAELADGLANLEKLITDLADRQRTMNEAETRFHIIDRVIVECLGWPHGPEEFRLERAQGREYSDYELGRHPVAIWEAKREGKAFEIPSRRQSSIVHSLASVMLLSEDCKAAIEQVNQYCIRRGVELCVATNGHQIVAFKADPDLNNRSSNKCVLFESLDHLKAAFPRAWQLLSPGAVANGELFHLVAKASAPKPPENYRPRSRTILSSGSRATCSAR